MLKPVYCSICDEPFESITTRNDHFYESHSDMLSVFIGDVKRFKLCSVKFASSVDKINDLCDEVAQLAEKIVTSDPNSGTTSVAFMMLFYALRSILENLVVSVLRRHNIDIDSITDVTLDNILAMFKNLLDQQSDINYFYTIKNITSARCHAVVRREIADSLSDDMDIWIATRVINLFDIVFDISWKLLKRSIDSPDCEENRSRGKININNSATGNVGTPYKVTLCRHWRTKGYCLLGNDCSFAHGLNDLHANVCKFYARGNCMNGKKCKFLHVV